VGLKSVVVQRYDVSPCRHETGIASQVYFQGKEAVVLVLSRRLNEKIVIPTLGVTIEIVGLKGNTVKLGIAAPPDVTLMRHEISADIPIVIGPAPHDPSLLRASVAGLSEQSGATLENLQRDKLINRTFEPRNNLVHTTRSRLRALVVEDDQNERELLARLLRLNGCECHTAADGLIALDYLASHGKPDLVLLDLCMPRCDGRQTVARIRGDHRYRGLKVFAVSGTRPEEAGICTGPNGVDGWFPKPLNTRIMWETIRSQFAICSGAD
jgi:carbon storage regulator CsrA